ncbi:lysosome-associated membrane glycoprotein 1b [Thalassophryne amazonica]|uniref:lysosome-associated membrane glycoprotein 1b n=1 Tax=Thalassophryne amazonica TaxID=390379 RepID=UPI0014710289|nr:lysosome-associated membrane glycoprotein 1b [Thalassophryne amazonica]XP_034042229.1 lysosome-associated membrane glycoprotein 1b [Thalassophryne amazonica]
MMQISCVPSPCLGVTLFLLFTATLQQSFATVAPPTPTQTPAPPHKDPGTPERGNYTVRNSSGTVCLLAYMGLQLNVSYSTSSQTKAVQVVNLQPSHTNSSGSCNPDSTSLLLTSDTPKTNLTFFFTLNVTSGKYRLSGVSLSALWPNMTKHFTEHNNSLDYLRGTLGHSYMCRTAQTLRVTPDFSVSTFELQVQPFGVTGDQFGSAEECQLDEDDMLIPIVVGAALAGLVVIVLLAYLIGRKRSHAGYQTI